MDSHDRYTAALGVASAIEPDLAGASPDPLLADFLAVAEREHDGPMPDANVIAWLHRFAAWYPVDRDAFGVGFNAGHRAASHPPCRCPADLDEVSEATRRGMAQLARSKPCTVDAARVSVEEASARRRAADAMRDTMGGAR